MSGWVKGGGGGDVLYPRLFIVGENTTSVPRELGVVGPLEGGPARCVRAYSGCQRFSGEQGAEWLQEISVLSGRRRTLL